MGKELNSLAFGISKPGFTFLIRKSSIYLTMNGFMMLTRLSKNLFFEQV
jgi:hypothetical protein